MDSVLVAVNTVSLAHDVPVDRAHVEELKRSIAARGQITPIMVRKGTLGIIDGFHRVTALHELAQGGLASCAEAHVVVVDCDGEGFQDARILSAAMHKSVSFARVTLWVLELFLGTKWAGRLKASEAFRIGGKRGQYVSMTHWGNAMERKVAPMSAAELHELARWVKAKADVWGLSADQVANMLSLAEIASPLLVSLVTERKSRGDRVLTRPMLREIAGLLPDHALQEAVALKAAGEGLSEAQTLELVNAVKVTPEQGLPDVLTTRWLDRVKPGAYTAPMPPGSTLVSLCTATARNLVGWLSKLAEAPPEAELGARGELAQALTDVVVAVATYQGAPSGVSAYLRTELSRLTAANKSLTRELKSVRTQLQRVERSVKLGQSKYLEDNLEVDLRGSSGRNA